MSFELPSIYSNPAGWGPPKTEDGLPFDIPYQPFWKSEKLGKVLEWLPDRMGRGRGGKFGYTEVAVDEEEKEWTTADYHKAQPKYRPGRGKRRGGFPNRGGFSQARKVGGGPARPGMAKPKKKLDTRPDIRRKDVHRQASVEVKQSWVPACHISIAELITTGKEQPYDSPKASEELLDQNGKPHLARKDMTTLASSIEVPNLNRAIDNSAPLDSSTMLNFIKKFRKHDGPAFYGTDMIIATLMSSPKATVPWDIQIERVGDSYFMSHAKHSIVGRWTVNETSADPPPCEEPAGANATEEQKNNSQPRLSEELTTLTNNFAQMLLDYKKEFPVKEKIEPAPVPDDIEGRMADVLYIYKKWMLPNNMLLCARTYVDGFLTPKEPYRAFPYLVKGPWKNTGIGAVTGTEIQNNCCRLIKQLAVTYLAGAKHMQIGFITRSRADNRRHHTLHHIESLEVKHRAAALSTHAPTLWNILIRILSEIVKAKSSEKNQKFILMKDPIRAILRLYDITNSAEDSEEDEDDDDEEEEEEESEDSN